jgi:hypothetical protein
MTPSCCCRTNLCPTCESLMTGQRKLYALASICLWIALRPVAADAQDFVQLSSQATRIADRCYVAASYFGQKQIRCAFMEQQRQAQLAARAYRAALARHGLHERRRLVASQAAWQSSIDRKCNTKALHSPTPIGTIATVEGFSCLGGEAASRIEWLERRYRTGQRRTR